MTPEELLQGISALPLQSLRVPPIPPSGAGNHEIGILHLSDVQYGKVTDSYNSKIADDRLYELALHVAKVIQARKKDARIEELRLYVGGDIVEGEDIFRGQAHVIDQPVFAQAMHGASQGIAKLVLRLLQVVKRVRVVCVPGNHGREGDGGSPTNWDLVTCEVAKHKLLGGQDLHPGRKQLSQRITFAPIGKWYQVDRVFGWGNLLVHGHQFKGSFTGSGFKSKVVGWIDTIPEKWDFIWFGHFHTLASGVINNRMFFANGTTESDNAYAAEWFAATGHPVQRLAFFNQKYGLVADYPIYLAERKPK